MIDRAGLLHLVGDEAIELVEEENPKLLSLGERHGGAAIIENVAERGKLFSAAKRAAREPSCGGFDDLLGDSSGGKKKKKGKK